MGGRGRYPAVAMGKNRTFLSKVAFGELLAPYSIVIGGIAGAEESMNSLVLGTWHVQCHRVT